MTFEEFSTEMRQLVQSAIDARQPILKGGFARNYGKEDECLCPMEMMIKAHGGPYLDNDSLARLGITSREFWDFIEGFDGIESARLSEWYDLGQEMGRLVAEAGLEKWVNGFAEAAS